MIKLPGSDLTQEEMNELALISERKEWNTIENDDLGTILEAFHLMWELLYSDDPVDLEQGERVAGDLYGAALQFRQMMKDIAFLSNEVTFLRTELAREKAYGKV